MHYLNNPFTYLRIWIINNKKIKKFGDYEWFKIEKF